MACGDRYAHLIRTRDGGTPERPYLHGVTRVPLLMDKDVPDEFDVFAWSEAARDLNARVRRHWRRLIEAEVGAGEATAPEDPQAPIIDPDFDAYNREVERLPSWWTALVGGLSTAKSLTDRAIGNMRDGTCLLERIDDAIVATGVNAPAVPSKPEVDPKKAPEFGLFDTIVGGVLITGMLVGGGYLAYRVVREKREIDAG